MKFRRMDGRIPDHCLEGWLRMEFLQNRGPKRFQGLRGRGGVWGGVGWFVSAPNDFERCAVKLKNAKGMRASESWDVTYSDSFWIFYETDGKYVYIFAPHMKGCLKGPNENEKLKVLGFWWSNSGAQHVQQQDATLEWTASHSSSIFTYVYTLCNNSVFDKQPHNWTWAQDCSFLVPWLPLLWPWGEGSLRFGCFIHRVDGLSILVPSSQKNKGPTEDFFCVHSGCSA